MAEYGMKLSVYIPLALKTNVSKKEIFSSRLLFIRSRNAIIKSKYADNTGIVGRRADEEEEEVVGTVGHPSCKLCTVPNCTSSPAGPARPRQD